MERAWQIVITSQGETLGDKFSMVPGSHRTTSAFQGSTDPGNTAYKKPSHQTAFSAQTDATPVLELLLLLNKSGQC